MDKDAIELEYKYYIPERYSVNDIIKDSFWLLFPLEEWQKECFPARYFLDEEQILFTNKISVRLRSEGSEQKLCVKQSLQEDSELSKRKEFEFDYHKSTVDVNTVIALLQDHYAQEASSAIRILSQVGKNFSDYTLVSDVHRFHTRIVDSENVFALSIDDGYLRVGSSEEKCFELEIEYISGNLHEFHQLAQTIQKHFSLIYPSENKYVRLHRLWEMQYGK